MAIAHVTPFDPQNPPMEAGHWYVYVRNGARIGLLAGPFASAIDADAQRAATRQLAESLDPWAEFYTFGVCRTETDRGPGRLNARLAGGR